MLGDETGPPIDPAAIAFGLYWLLAAIAESGPVVLLVDDLHACDRASLQWLSFLSRRLAGIGVAVVAAGRAFDPASLPHVAVLRPEPLGVAATHALVVARIGSATPDLVEACVAATGGNPLLLVGLLEALVASGVTPDEVDIARIEVLAGDRLGSALLGRRGQLDAPGRALARCGRAR